MIKKNSELFASILYIIIGALLMVFKSETLGWAMTVAGVFFIISGVLDVIKRNFIGGGISLVIGIAILVLGWLVVEIVLLVLGVLIAIKGVLALISVFKRPHQNALEIVFPILTIVIGGMLAFGNGLDVMIIIVGALLTIDGVIGLLGSLKK